MGSSVIQGLLSDAPPSFDGGRRVSIRSVCSRLAADNRHIYLAAKRSGGYVPSAS